MKKKEEPPVQINTDVLEMVNGPGWGDYVREIRKIADEIRPVLLGAPSDTREYLRGKFEGLQQSLEQAYRIVREPLPDSIKDLFR